MVSEPARTDLWSQSQQHLGGQPSLDCQQYCNNHSKGRYKESSFDFNLKEFAYGLLSKIWNFTMN